MAMPVVDTRGRAAIELLGVEGYTPGGPVTPPTVPVLPVSGGGTGTGTLPAAGNALVSDGTQYQPTAIATQAALDAVEDASIAADAALDSRLDIAENTLADHEVRIGALEASGGGGARGLAFPFGDGSTAETAGAVRRLPVPFGYTVTGWNITADASCSAQFQVQARGFGESLVNLVGAGTAPSIAAATEARDTDGTLDWTSTSVAADGEAVVTLMAYTPGTSTYVGLTLKIEEAT